MNDQKIDQLIVAIESLTTEVKMLGHGDATGRKDEPQFGAIELFGMKLLDKIDSTANLAHIQSIKRDVLFAAVALGGLLARYGSAVDLKGNEQVDKWACLAWKYADALDAKFDDEKDPR